MTLYLIRHAADYSLPRLQIVALAYVRLSYLARDVLDRRGTAILARPYDGPSCLQNILGY